MMIAIPDCGFALWIQSIESFNDEKHRPLPLPMGMLFGLGVVVVLALGVFMLHEIGEGVCNLLEKRGIQLRPRRVIKISLDKI